MREESHLDDMRSAIRGDFDRLARRRGAQELMRVGDEPDAKGTAAADHEVETASVEESLDEAPVVDSDPQEGVVVEAASEAEVVPEPELEAPVPRSWLDRLLGR